MKFLNFLKKYEKEDVKDVIKATNEHTRQLKAIIKEAFYGEFVGKTEAILRIKNEFTNKKLAPKTIDVKYVKENVNSIIEKINNLSEGNIKIIINNDVEKETEVKQPPLIGPAGPEPIITPIPPIPSLPPTGPEIDVVTDIEDKSEEEEDKEKEDDEEDDDDEKEKVDEEMEPDDDKEVIQDCNKNKKLKKEGVELRMNGDGYKMKMDDKDLPKSGYKYMDEEDEDISDEESAEAGEDITDEFEDVKDEEELKWSRIEDKLDALDNKIQKLVDTKTDEDEDEVSFKDKVDDDEEEYDETESEEAFEESTKKDDNLLIKESTKWFDEYMNKF